MGVDVVEEVAEEDEVEEDAEGDGDVLGGVFEAVGGVIVAVAPSRNSVVGAVGYYFCRAVRRGLLLFTAGY